MATLTLDTVQKTAQSNPKDEIIFGWMNEEQFDAMLEQVKKEWFSAPFTPEEAILHVKKIIQW